MRFSVCFQRARTACLLGKRKRVRFPLLGGNAHPSVRKINGVGIKIVQSLNITTSRLAMLTRTEVVDSHVVMLRAELPFVVDCLTFTSFGST